MIVVSLRRVGTSIPVNLAVEPQRRQSDRVLEDTDADRVFRAGDVAMAGHGEQEYLVDEKIQTQEK